MLDCTRCREKARVEDDLLTPTKDGMGKLARREGGSLAACFAARAQYVTLMLSAEST